MDDKLLNNIICILVIVVACILAMKIITSCRQSNTRNIDKFNNTNKTKCQKCYDVVAKLNDKLNEHKNNLAILKSNYDSCDNKNSKKCKDITNSINDTEKAVDYLNKQIDAKKCECNLTCAKENVEQLVETQKEYNSKIKKCKSDVECLNLKRQLANSQTSIDKGKQNVKYYECACANCLSLEGGYTHRNCMMNVCNRVFNEEPRRNSEQSQAKEENEQEKKNNIIIADESTSMLVSQEELMNEAEKLKNNNNGRLSKQGPTQQKTLNQQQNRSTLVEVESNEINLKKLDGVIDSSLGYAGYNSVQEDRKTNNLGVISQLKKDNRTPGTLTIGKMNEQKGLVLKSDKDNSKQHVEDLLEYGNSATSLGQYDFGMGQTSNTVNAVTNVDVEQAHLHKNNIREAPIIYQSGVSGVSNVFAPHIIVNEGSGNLNTDSGNTYDSSTNTNADNPFAADMNGIPGLEGAHEMEAIYFSD